MKSNGLRDWAEASVDHVIPEVAGDGESITGEEFVEFALCFTDHGDMIKLTEDWLNSYKEFVGLRFHDRLQKVWEEGVDTHRLVLQWRVTPEIEQHVVDEHPMPGEWRLYMRLLITERSGL